MNVNKLLRIMFILISLMIFSCNNKNVNNENIANESKKAEEISNVQNESLQNDKDIVIFSTNDVYSNYDEKLGYAGLKYYIDNFDKNENYMVLVDVGNFSSGNDIAKNSKGMSSIEIMNKINYDFIVPGTHEFDYGIDVFKKNMDALGNKIISCNIIDMSTERLMYDPYRIVKIGKKNIAFIGVTNPETLYLQNKNIFFDDNGNQLIYFFEDETGEALYIQIQKCVDEARKEGADIVILLSHLGNENVDPRWQSTTILENTDGIDACIDGHSMELLDSGLMLNKSGGFVPMVQAGMGLEYIGVINITKSGYIFPAVISKNSVKIKDEEMTKFIKELREKYKTQ